MDSHNYSGPYVFIGPPGCGKTTTLRMQLSRLAEASKAIGWDAPIIVCSLTKTAARQIGGAEETGLSRQRVGTLHALAYAALDKPKIAEAHIKEFNSCEAAFALSGANVKLDEDFDSSDDWRAPGDHLLSELQLLRARMVPPNKWPARVSEFAEAWGSWKLDAGYMDFTDIIEACIANEAFPKPKMKYLMVDECQDLSPLEWSLIKLWAAQCEASFYCGDPLQELYSWRGAGSDIFWDNSIPADHKKVLIHGHRVPKKIVEATLGWMRAHYSRKDFPEYLPTAETGAINIELNATFQNPDAVCLKAAELSEKETVMLLAPCGYQLEPAIAFLRKEGIPFANPWRAKRGDWNPLAKRKGVSTAARIQAFLQRKPWSVSDVKAWAEMIPATGHLMRGGRKAIEALAESNPDAPASGKLGDWFEPDTAIDLEVMHARNMDAPCADLKEWLAPRIRGQFKNQADYALKVLERGGGAMPGEVRFFTGTIHSVKGGEAKHVFLFTDLSAQGLARMRFAEGMDEICRLFYVGLTRASKSVTVIRPARHGMGIPIRGLLG